VRYAIRSSYPLFDATSSRLLTLAKDGTARLWAVDGGAPIATLEGSLDVQRNFPIARYIAFSPDGTRLAAVARDGTARMWNARDGTPLAVRTGVFTADSPPMFNHDGSLLLLPSAAPSDLRSRSFAWLPVGAVLGLLFSLTRAVRAAKTRPNQGMLLTARNSVVVGVAVALIGALAAAAVAAVQEWSEGLSLIATIAGAMVAFGYGSVDVVQHYVLRAVIRVTGTAPSNLVRFLDDASERVVLRKVGGGYIFIHRSLLEYFAGDEDNARAPANQPGPATAGAR
jgi:hypothetical protein